MKVIPWLQKALIDFFIINLFLTLVSLPVLVAWGLPLSWLSPFGNLIFSPFLSLFLLISTLSFFCELMHLPHTTLDYALEKVTAVWHALLQLAPNNSFVGFSYTAVYLLTIISLTTLILLMLPQFRVARLRLCALTILFLCSLTILKATQPAKLNTTLSCFKKDMELIRQDNQTLLIDQGALCERANPASWVQYHLVPDLIRTTGSMHVDHLLLTRPTIRALEAAAALMQHINIQKLYYPAIEGEMTGSHRGAFRKFYAIAKEKGVKLQRIRTVHVIQLGDKAIQIVLGKEVKYRDVVFQKITTQLC
jgi:beta-lactamase superfamily II metal-dependent hydrolase